MNNQKYKSLSSDPRHSLNSVCPYYTMFPLEFPISVLKRVLFKDAVVLDVFCGRGTTNYAARALGFESYGVDTSPIACAIAEAKLCSPTADSVLSLLERLLHDTTSVRVPEGEFWSRAYNKDTLRQILKIRRGLLHCRNTDAAKFLRAIMLGSLHGPLAKNIEESSYLSNQMPRTFAAKPSYSLKFWKRHKLFPPKIDVRNIVKKRVNRLLKCDVFNYKKTKGKIIFGDSRDIDLKMEIGKKINLVITSPPYYGMNTYIQDQWLRSWFLGSSSMVQYDLDGSFSHSSHESFSRNLANVWDNVYKSADSGIHMVVRFGAIGSSRSDPNKIMQNSLDMSVGDWSVYKILPAGNASKGKRQALSMGSRISSGAYDENDYFIRMSN